MSTAQDLQPDSKSEYEKPLPATKHGLYLAASTALILLYYFYCAVMMVAGSVMWVLLVLVGLAGAQYGVWAASFAMVSGYGAILVETARSLRLANSVEYLADLNREEAPELWREVEGLASQLQVQPPQQIRLEAGLTAWVRLKGFAQGRGQTQLGIGYDMLTGLTADQARAVLAHEIAHAKYVRRGYQGFLMRGYYRLLQYTRSLQVLAGSKDVADPSRRVAERAVFIPKKISNRVGRWISACSRYDEFLADRVSAEICGSEISCSALMSTHVLDFQSSRIDWRDRVVHAERTPGYTEWLRGQLEVPDETRRRELEERVVTFARRHELDTHPALPDRLAALQELNFPTPPSAGGQAGSLAVYAWLVEPDSTARRMLRELEKIAAEAERKHTDRLHSKMKRAEFLKNATLHYIFGVIFCFGWAAMFAWAWWLNRYSGSPEAGNDFLGYISLFCVAIGLGTLYQALQPKVQLPFPSFSAYRAAGYHRWEEEVVERQEYGALSAAPAEDKPLIEAIQDERTAQERSQLAAELRSNAPELSKRAALRHWLNEAIRHLGEADYERALHCAHFALEQKPHHKDAVMIVSLCRANRGDRQALSTLHESLMNRSHFNGQWAMAWCGTLAHEYNVSEAYLLQVSRRRPELALLWGLLGTSQAFTGKPRESLASRKKALELALAAGDIVEEACHRQALAQSFITLGMVEEATREFDWLDRHLKTHGVTRGLHEKRLHIDRLRWLLSSEQTEKALALVDEALSGAPRSGEKLGLAEVLMETKDESIRSRTQTICEELLAEGHYPQLHQSLSQIAFDREEKELALTWLMGALDLTKTRPPEASHPLNLLDEIVAGMRVIADRQPAAVKAWECHLEAPNTPLTVKKLSLLCLYPTEEEAVAAARTVFEGLLPGAALEGLTSVTLGEESLQPEEEMPPGIYGSRW